MQQYTVQYGPPGRYFVRREEDKTVVKPFDNKSACIAHAEDLNGWKITGSEAMYATSAATDKELDKLSDIFKKQQAKASDAAKRYDESKDGSKQKHEALCDLRIIGEQIRVTEARINTACEVLYRDI